MSPIIRKPFVSKRLKMFPIMFFLIAFGLIIESVRSTATKYLILRDGLRSLWLNCSYAWRMTRDLVASRVELSPILHWEKDEICVVRYEDSQEIFDEYDRRTPPSYCSSVNCSTV